MDGFKGMGFVIKKILVHSEPTRVRGGEAHYNMVREKWDVRNLLEVNQPFLFAFYCYETLKFSSLGIPVTFLRYLTVLEVAILVLF